MFEYRIMVNGDWVGTYHSPIKLCVLQAWEMVNAQGIYDEFEIEGLVSPL